MLLDLRQRVADRARPGQRAATDQRLGQTRGGACHPPRARPTLIASAPPEKPIDAVLADADDGQPARGRAACARVIDDRMRVLILGGTTEASALAQLLAGDPRFEATLSLAGRTAAPQAQPIATRVGGFGGADGLASFLREAAIDAVIDATHPYAPRISANAVVACKRDRRRAGLAPPSRLDSPSPATLADRLRRRSPRPWPSAQQPRRVFLSSRPPGTALLRRIAAASLRRPPHRAAGRRAAATISFCCSSAGRSISTPSCACLKERKIDVIVSRNSGGSADLRQDRGGAHAWPARDHDRTARQARRPYRGPAPRQRGVARLIARPAARCAACRPSGPTWPRRAGADDHQGAHVGARTDRRRRASS